VGQAVGATGESPKDDGQDARFTGAAESHEAVDTKKRGQ